MSTEGKRCYRPAIHFTPESMWMNDPNGMVVIDGFYHFFYQHYPEDTKWGPMHWGHAVSKDLIHWEHLPIALYPDELGCIFSGSCIYDRKNCSGYGREGKPPLIALFTSHGEKDGLEQQSIAYSLDYTHFEKSYLNPVIPNPGIKDFRDPKGFYNPVKDCYSLVLAAGEKVIFYESSDLKKWERSGEFVPQGACAVGICECPDCFPVETGDGVKWVLIISMIIPVPDQRKVLHRTLYFVGDFDGNTFIPDSGFKEPVWLDGGLDHYAAVSFQNHDKPVIMGWASSWGYADRLPTGVYCGQATLARQVQLTMTEQGYRIIQKPLGLDELRQKKQAISGEERLSTNSFGLQISGEGNAKIILSNTQGRELTIELTDKHVIADRTKADDKSFHPVYAMEESCVAVVPREASKIDLELIFDVSILELFSEGGKETISMCAFPEEPFDKIRLEGAVKAEFYLLQ